MNVKNVKDNISRVGVVNRQRTTRCERGGTEKKKKLEASMSPDRFIKTLDGLNLCDKNVRTKRKSVPLFTLLLDTLINNVKMW
jgi:hypothetical protein